jgi:hypothetical protein
MARMARSGFLATILMALAFLAALPPDIAIAQRLPPADVGQQPRRLLPVPQPQRRGGLLDFLFGPRMLQPPPIAPFGIAPPGQQPKARSSEPPVVTVEVVEKDPKAKKILVLGDFVAGGLAWGLDQTFAEEPKIAVIDRSNNASGLVRADYYDWNAQLLAILNEEKPDIVVVELGANDRQQMRLGQERLAPRSEAWERLYVQRIVGMAETLKVFGRPFFWVGVPPMRQSSAMRDMAYLNDLYRPPVTAAGGHFVDIWGGFTDENGRYISSGPDVGGQLRALRSGDGINFTRAGRLKLAFYVEREIRRQTGIGTGAVDLLASTDQQSQIEIGPDGQKRLVGPVISLSDPLPGASDLLAGGPEEAPLKPGETPQYLMIVKGAALPVVGGRADDFTWPPRPAAAPPSAPAN